jgi:hypothetical protein
MGNHSQFLDEETLPISEIWHLVVENLIIPHHPDTPSS